MTIFRIPFNFITLVLLMGSFLPALGGDKTKAQKVGSGADDDYVVTSSTRINFDDTLIEGKMQAPNGFFLQGRTSQSLNQMVRLRSNFSSELKNSKSGVSALAK